MKNPFRKRLSRYIRGRWREKALLRHGVAIVAETKNGLLAVQPGDFNVSRELLRHGEYDWPSIRWLRSLLRPKARLVFAGAHIGAILVPLVSACAESKALAFEPSPRNFQLLSMNLALNGLASVTARNVAIGEFKGQIAFTENHINTGNSRIARDGGEITVEVDTLDDAVPKEWDDIDLIVMDIEGSEVAAMRGAHRVLSATRYLYVEFAPEQLREQQSCAAEFVALAAKYFKSAYVVGSPIIFLGPGEFASHLQGLENREGLLLNVLFTKDMSVNPALVQA